MLTIRSRVITSLTLGMLFAGVPATGTFAAEAAPSPPPVAPIGPSEVPVYPVPIPLESVGEADWHPIATPDPPQPAPAFPTPPPVDLTSELEAAWAANHPPGTAQAPSTGGSWSDGALAESAQFVESVPSAEPAAALPDVAASGPRLTPSDADEGLWLRVERGAVRAAPDRARAEFVVKGEITRAIEERRSARAGLTRTGVVLIGGLLGLGAIVGTVALPQLRRRRRA